MAKTLIVNLTDELEQALTLQAQQLNKSPEEVVLDLLSRRLTPLPQAPTQSPIGDDPLLQLIGSIHVEDIHDLGENHDHYIGQALYQELHPDE